jgi:hypothetical protein
MTPRTKGARAGLKARKKAGRGPRDPLAFLHGLGRFALSVAFILLASFAIAWPLWTFAARNKPLFSRCFIAALLLFSAYIASRALVRRLGRKGRAARP